MPKFLTKVMPLILIIAITLPLTTAFAAPPDMGETFEIDPHHFDTAISSQMLSESFHTVALPEIEPYYFDPNMISRVSDFDALSAEFSMPMDMTADLSRVTPEINELSELPP
ncbi:MAG: hypothetical protein FWC66_07320, partial [Oscillospiraceae bacterium]|nr:hypothetical protein [Oscillospiraceae bacterium]